MESPVTAVHLTLSAGVEEADRPTGFLLTVKKRLAVRNSARKQEKSRRDILSSKGRTVNTNYHNTGSEVAGDERLS